RGRGEGSARGAGAGPVRHRPGAVPGRAPGPGGGRSRIEDRGSRIEKPKGFRAGEERNGKASGKPPTQNPGRGRSAILGFGSSTLEADPPLAPPRRLRRRPL